MPEPKRPLSLADPRRGVQCARRHPPFARRHELAVRGTDEDVAAMRHLAKTSMGPTRFGRLSPISAI